MGRSALKNPKIKLIILILSEKNNKDRRDIQRQTWLKNINIHYRFVLGGEPKKAGDSILWTDSPDDNLPRKLISAYQRISDRYDFDYIFTCDDDTYVVVDRLLSCGFEDHMYMGNCYTFEEGIREGMGHAEGGAGFFLSHEAIERIVQVPLDHELLTGPSDTAIGDLAKMYSIKLRSDDRFVQGYSIKKRHGELPMPFNEVITSHYLSPALFHMVHSQFTHQYWKRQLALDPKVQQAKALI